MRNPNQTKPVGCKNMSFSIVMFWLLGNQTNRDYIQKDVNCVLVTPGPLILTNLSSSPWKRVL